MTIKKSNVVEFKPNQIGHLKINDDADAAYGLGFIWPSVKALENFVQNEYDVHRLMTRKAGAPYHVKLGQPGEIVQQGDIDDFKTKLEYQNTRTEWVTDGSVEITAIDFGKLGESLTSLIKQDLLMIYAGFQIPEVLVGSGQLNEGIAKVQLEGIQRKAASIQEKIESILEEKVFKPLLLAQNLDGDGKSYSA